MLRAQPTWIWLDVVEAKRLGVKLGVTGAIVATCLDNDAKPMTAESPAYLTNGSFYRSPTDAWYYKGKDGHWATLPDECTAPGYILHIENADYMYNATETCWYRDTWTPPTKRPAPPDHYGDF